MERIGFETRVFVEMDAKGQRVAPPVLLSGLGNDAASLLRVQAFDAIEKRRPALADFKARYRRRWS